MTQLATDDVINRRDLPAVIAKYEAPHRSDRNDVYEFFRPGDSNKIQIWFTKALHYRWHKEIKSRILGHFFTIAAIQSGAFDFLKHPEEDIYTLEDGYAV